MNYSVSLLYKSVRSDGATPLWEEQIILVSAQEESEAKLKGERHGKEQEHSHNTRDSVKIEWKFHKVERVFLIDDELREGAELFSRFLSDSEAESILKPFEDE